MASPTHIQRTLILLKPDAMMRGVAGQIIKRFERAGLKLVGCTMRRPDKDFYYHHYETIGTMVTRRGEDAFHKTLEMMEEGPVLAMVWEGVEVVEVVRKMVGTTEPKTAAPGTIRGDFAHMSFAHSDATHGRLPNLIHASGDPEEAEAEIKHWFAPEELYDYQTTYEPHTR